jgi:thiamine-monophosphate kinase
MTTGLTEFELIDRYFRAVGAARRDVLLGIGDDGALLRPPPGHDLVAVTDTLVEGLHFPLGSPAESIGHRALAVNLSDVAAMGGTPAWALLALSLPRPDADWLRAFADGFSRLASAHDVALVGGDTTGGSLSVTVQVLGFVPTGQGLRRSGGQPGDCVCVSGTPGDAAAGLAIELGRSAPGGLDQAWLRDRFLFPQPRVALGTALRGWASACIDVSDGLAADLGKLAAASGCGARIDAARLPLSPALMRVYGIDGGVQTALGGGDDYELCFAVPAARMAGFAAACPAERHGWRAIGSLQPGAGVEILRGDSVTPFTGKGFDHFAR